MCKISILHIITTIDIGGAEKQLQLLSAQQSSLGRNVTVMPLKGRVELYDDFTNSQVAIDLSLFQLNPISQLRLVRRFIRMNQPSIIHAHLPRSELLVWAAFSIPFLRCQGRFVVSRHNAEAFVPKVPSLISSWVSRLVLKKTHAVIAISEAVREFLFRHQEVSKKQEVQVVYYGADLKQKRPPIKHKRDSENLTLKTVCLARFVEQKNHRLLIDAAESIKSEVSFKIDLFGEGPLKNEIATEILKRNLNPIFSIHSKVNFSFDKLAEYDILILPSRYEGFGLVLLEAMLAGIGIIASNTSAIPEVLGKECQGLFEPDSCQDLASKILRFSTNSELIDLKQYSSARLSRFNIIETERLIYSIYSS